MLQVPSDVGEKFEVAMQATAVAEHLRPHFRRWLRFYLDFCAKYVLQANYDIRTIQELLGHSDVRTTMIYTHTLPSVTIKEAKSPLDL